MERNGKTLCTFKIHTQNSERREIYDNERNDRIKEKDGEQEKESKKDRKKGIKEKHMCV